MTAPILVTGGTGFLGRHLVPALLSEGHTVRILHRRPDPWVKEVGAESVQGDLLDGDALRRAAEGCSEVVHLAGWVTRDRRKAGALRELHVGGAQQVLEVCGEQNIGRILYASTSGALACSEGPESRPTEDNPHLCPIVHSWPYYQTKIEAEELLQRGAQERSIKLITLNPSLLLGPGDPKGNSVVDVQRVLDRKLPALPTGGLNFVDVRDVAQAALAARKRGRAGERYLLGGANWSLRRFFQRIGELSGVPVPPWTAPDRLTWLAARVVEPAARKLGKRPPLDVVGVEMSQVFWYFASAKAEAELGFVARDPDETLTDTIADLRGSFV